MATDDLGPLIASLRAIVGRRHVLTGPSATRRYRTGYRADEGAAAAVIRPRSLVEQWRVLQRLVEADAIVILQAANTGLTGGSTPAAGGYDRPVFILNTLRIRGIHLIDGGRQVVCLPGTTLYQLETLLRPLGREPHSVIGSSCLGASVIGGVCNNSGGALVRRGPAYTELALYAQVAADGTLHLVNHLGIALGDDAEAMLDRLDAGRLGEVGDGRQAASDHDYAQHVRDVDAPTPARFNADPRRLFEASGSAGRIAVFAVRLDTFPAETGTRIFYVGTNDPNDFTALRRAMLQGLDTPPIAAEYMHREAFDVTTRYGRDTVQAIRLLGTDRLPWLFAVKDRVDRLLGHGAADRLLQRLGRLLPNPLPTRLRSFRDRYEHYLMMKVDDRMAEATAALLRTSVGAGSGDWFEADPHEGRIAFLHRFAAAGAAVRYRAVHAAETQEVLALDIALPRSTRDWFEVLPADIAAACVRRLYYGHFFCHVLHHDYVLAKGADPAAIKTALLERFAVRGARYPAEHNVGSTYAADPAQLAFYRNLDPANVLNPGIGRSSRRRGWR